MLMNIVLKNLVSAMAWKKIKHLFVPSNHYDWMYSHASNPVPFILDNEREIVRVFFSTRTKENVSHIGFVDIDFKNHFEILNISKKPVLEPGSLGLFDDSGTSMGFILKHNNVYYLFYLGWNLKVTVPWLNAIGLAISQSIDGPFEKIGLAPIMDRSNEDPFSISYPTILYENNLFKMWYGSNLTWGSNQNQMNHVIKYAESIDLLTWRRTNQIHIPLQYPNEYALSKPWVIREKGMYKMWYSFRGNFNIETYRIGYAESQDGYNWTRKDKEVNIDVSAEGWDNQMICYPSVIELNNKKYMLYNGNDYGRTGFGISIFQE
jgi:hypothetical protein